MSSHVVGLRVTLNQILVYVVAAVLYAIAGVALAGLLRNPGVNVGSPYLLGPIAAVVIGGASLAGGLASPMSTFAAAFFLTGLNQMMRTMGLPTSLQFVVFGLVIIGGMLVSGDRIIRGVEQVLRERQTPKPLESRAIGDVQRGSMRREAGISESDRSTIRVASIRAMASAIDQGEVRTCRRSKIIGIVADARRWSAAACSSGDDDEPAATGTDRRAPPASAPASTGAACRSTGRAPTRTRR